MGLKLAGASVDTDEAVVPADRILLFVAEEVREGDFFAYEA